MKSTAPHGWQPRPALVVASVILLASPAAVLSSPPSDEVRSILQRCVACHGGQKARGGLQLTTRTQALKGGDSGPALVPGKADKSLLYEQVASKRMPPKSPLSRNEIAILAKWIDEGAAWDDTIEKARAGTDWWSLQPLRSPALPVVRNAGWGRNSIDAFVLARLEQMGIKPAPEADRATLLRRLTFDLIGLPPTPGEIRDFVDDRSADAHEKAVDRLLASPHYGERWGRHWLDVARFGESQGYERDKMRPNAWRYREYVIGALNRDISYADFIRDQLAGDVHGGANQHTMAATGFLVAGPWDEVGANQQSAVNRKRAREEELEDMLSATAQTFLGMTVNCARCHDHKFDPIPQRDYYRLKAALEGVRHGDRTLLTPDQVRRRDARSNQLLKEIANLESKIAAVERTARAKVLEGQGRPRSNNLVEPIGRWTFESDARDGVGRMHGTLQGGAMIREGRLHLQGKTALMKTAPLARDLRARTLEVWTTLANLKQRGGGVMTVQDRGGKVFDAIVFAERQPGRWIAGSSFFHRTRDLGGPDESAKPDELVHLAIAYAEDSSITLYRNGSPYGSPYTPSGENGSLQTYRTGDGHVLFGLRHTGAGNGFFAGQIEEARLYDRALSAEEVRASFQAGVERVPVELMLAAMTPREQKEREDALSLIRERRLQLEKLKDVPVGYAANPMPPEPTFVLHRGDVLKPGERVAAGGLSAVGTSSAEWGLNTDAPEGLRRLKLAEWIASDDNPLTARVIVNRVWHYHFGQGIVATPSDLGFNGARPTHPELLDWLAFDFTQHGGSLKHLHRRIVTSSAYRQGADFNPEASRVDADNRFLWRFPPRRLEGEAVRDAMLAVSGELNTQVGGPSFQPFVVKVFNSHFYNLTDPIGHEYNRRTVYRMSVGSARSPFLDAFDCPEPSVKAPDRNATTTPLQALALMNNSFVLRQADRFARRIERERATLPEQVTAAYLHALGRPPGEEERALATPLVREHGLKNLCWVLLNSSEFLYVR